MGEGFSLIMRRGKGSLMNSENTSQQFPLPKRIFLTFDDGPSKKYTPKILSILKKFSVKATFFCVGKQARKYPDIIARIFEEGHDLGNHTYSHPVSPIFQYKRIKEEIIATGEIIERITGHTLRLFRPTWGPWDMHSQELLRLTEQLGYRSVRWSRSSIDWLGMKFLIRRQVTNNNFGSHEVLLFHDGSEKSPVWSRKATVELLPEILENAIRNNIYPQRLSEFSPLSRLVL